MIGDTVGKSVRLGRLFGTEGGRARIVAVDHGTGGVPAGLEDLGYVIQQIVAEKPDGVILTAAAFKRWHALFASKTGPSAIIAMDALINGTLPGSANAEEHRLITTVEEAVCLGADAAKVLLVFGRRDARVHAHNIEMVAELVDKCRHFGLPLMVEPALWGQLVPRDQQNDSEMIRHICRISVELGADIVKMPMPADADVLRQICDTSPVPITILGGAPRPDIAEAASIARSAIEHGAKGIVFGRNVWSNPDPKKAVRALKAALLTA